MKKFLILIPIFILLLTGCASNNNEVTSESDSPNSEIMGIWYTTSDTNGSSIATISFTDNGEFISTLDSVETNNSFLVEDGSGTYEINGDQLILNFESEGNEPTSETFTFSVNKNELTLTNDQNQSQVFTLDQD